MATAQKYCPPELRGRLAGLAAATAAVGAAVGTVTAGLLVDHVDIVPLFNSQALVYLVCGILSLLLIVRRLERQDEWEASEDTAFWRSVPEIADDIREARAERGMPIERYLAERAKSPE